MRFTLIIVVDKDVLLRVKFGLRKRRKKGNGQWEKTNKMRRYDGYEKEFIGMIDVAMSK